MILQLYILFCLKGGSLPPFILGLLCALSLLFLLLVRSLLARNFFISNGFVLRGPGIREKPFPRPLLFIPDPCFSRLISLAEPYTSHHIVTITMNLVDLSITLKHSKLIMRCDIRSDQIASVEERQIEININPAALRKQSKAKERTPPHHTVCSNVGKRGRERGKEGREHTLDFLISILMGTPSNLKSFWILDRRNRSKKPGISFVLQKNAKVGGRDLTWESESES